MALSIFRLRRSCSRRDGVQATSVCKGSYGDQLQETGGKRQIIVNWGDSEVKGLLLRAEDEVYKER